MKLLQVQVAAHGCDMDAQAATHGAGCAWRDGTCCSSASLDWWLEALKLSFSMKDGNKWGCWGWPCLVILMSPEVSLGSMVSPQSIPRWLLSCPCAMWIRNVLGLPVKARGWGMGSGESLPSRATSCSSVEGRALHLFPPLPLIVFR